MDDSILLPSLRNGSCGLLLLTCEVGGGDGVWHQSWPERWATADRKVRVRSEMIRNEEKIDSSNYHVGEEISSEVDDYIDRYVIHYI
jgi:hypothetical protein